LTSDFIAYEEISFVGDDVARVYHGEQIENKSRFDSPIWRTLKFHLTSHDRME